jgi:hypothetical protein
MEATSKDLLFISCHTATPPPKSNDLSVQMSFKFFSRVKLHHRPGRYNHIRFRLIRVATDAGFANLDLKVCMQLVFW